MTPEATCDRVRVAGRIHRRLLARVLPAQLSPSAVPARQLYDNLTCDLADYYPDEIQEFLAVLRTRWKTLSELTPAQRFTVLNYEFRQAHYIAGTFDLIGWRMQSSHPGFYRPLMRFCFNLPVEHLAGQGLYRRWLADRKRRTDELVKRRPARLWQRARVAVLDVVDAAVDRLRPPRTRSTGRGGSAVPKPGSGRASMPGPTRIGSGGCAPPPSMLRCRSR